MRKALVLIAAVAIAFAPVAAFAQFPKPVPAPAPAQQQLYEQGSDGQFHPIAPNAAAIGGPVGSPTYVVPSSKGGGVIDVGQAFGDIVGPYINALVQALLAAAAGWAFKRYHDVTGREIDAQHRDTITKALQNQASSLIADGMVKIKDQKVEVDSPALASAVSEVLLRAPQALKHFGLTPDVVSAKIVDAIPQVAAGAQMIASHATEQAKKMANLP